MIINELILKMFTFDILFWDEIGEVFLMFVDKRCKSFMVFHTTYNLACFTGLFLHGMYSEKQWCPFHNVGEISFVYRQLYILKVE